MHSVNSKHARHILQLIMTFTVQHYTTTEASGTQWQSCRVTLHKHCAKWVSASTDEDAQPVSLMYTHFHHMHEPSTDTLN